MFRERTEFYKIFMWLMLMTDISTHRTPVPLINQLWKHEDLGRENSVQEELHMPSGVKIIELNTSSDSSKGSSEDYSHAWTYVNNDRCRDYEENEYRVNEEARRKRRMNMKQYEDNLSTVYENQCYYNDDIQSNSNAFYDSYDSDSYTSMNHQTNCVTILNNQQAKSNSSGNENYEAIEMVQIDGTHKKYWDHVYNEQLVTYDPTTQTEKCTIWIYSYKNKHRLSDEYELGSIPCQDTSSTSSSASDKEKMEDKSTNVNRIGSPIPVTYIPRLDLSLVQTLSTVTEISEPTKLSIEPSHETVNIKPRNNWLSERNEKKKDKPSVVNWMALSPRERRRRSINTNLGISSKESVKETEVTHAEGSTQLDQISFIPHKVDSTTVEVQVDVHTHGHESFRNLATCTSSTEEPVPVKAQKVSDIFPIQVSVGDAGNDEENNNTKLDFSKKPSIKISTILNKNEITEPLEKLDCNNWITEALDEKEMSTYNYDSDYAEDINTIDFGSGNVDFDSASKRLWRKNMQLMKSPQWVDYLPITCSPTSIHLSLSLSSLNEKKSWLRRLIKCVKCCK